MDRSSSAATGSRCIDTLEDSTSPTRRRRSTRRSYARRSAEGIARLPEREKLVVTLYYFEELTLREIGEVLGVTESRVSQLHTKATMRLKSRLVGAPSREPLGR